MKRGTFFYFILFGFFFVCLGIDSPWPPLGLIRQWIRICLDWNL
jgi:hypothetical protein